MSRFRYALLLLLSILFIVPRANASVNVNIRDDAYDILSRLEAEGVVKSGMLTTRPLSRREVLRLVHEAERNSEGSSLFVCRLVQSLKEKFYGELDGKKYIKPVDEVYAGYIYSDSEQTEKIVYNNDGDRYDKGSNLRFGFSTIADAGWLSLYLNPEIRYSEKDTDIILKKGYGVFSFFGLDLEVGTDSQWWGPGYHGSLLYSNNAEPLTMIKLDNPHPFILPSVFRYLGLFKFSAFVSRLEKEWIISEPYLWGIRLAFKTSPYFEFGLQRTAILGGEDRKDNFRAWLDSLTGRGENIAGGVSDQRAGMDIKVTLPFKWQPVQIYAEVAGEDEAGGLPSKEAYLGGIYLPRILALERLSFRVEYADNHINSDIPWYEHGIYISGYTYKRRVIGHHMGADSRDIFLEATYYLPMRNSGSVSVSYDREEHNLSRRTGETIDEYAMLLNLPVTKTAVFEMKYMLGKLKNVNSIEGNNRDINIIIGRVTYRF